MSKNLKGCYSHITDDWKTPKDIFDAFMQNGYIDCFPFQSDYDEFSKDYYECKLFINPPYSKLDLVIDFVLKMATHDNLIALLIPVRTDTKYFKRLFEYQCNLVFIHGRLKFNDGKLSAPFPSMLVLINYSDSVNNFILLDKNELVRFINEEL